MGKLLKFTTKEERKPTRPMNPAALSEEERMACDIAKSLRDSLGDRIVNDILRELGQPEESEEVGDET